MTELQERAWQDLSRAQYLSRDLEERGIVDSSWSGVELKPAVWELKASRYCGRGGLFQIWLHDSRLISERFYYTPKVVGGWIRKVVDVDYWEGDVTTIHQSQDHGSEHTFSVENAHSYDKNDLVFVRQALGGLETLMTCVATGDAQRMRFPTVKS